MSASKTESQKIFEKLKLKPANKARNLLRLRLQEPNMVVCAFRYLPVP
ncbi:hypothetical protein RIB2604_01801050 [Aspergillus luchuensis]|uniref:Uncharacterized protein n=1 Tax=Aspergillus kawachii TaxID=1069201 RepID=A0A146FDZ6_ASPKA|nr:hypothetical protein RIB2604_01801050 [Aspergillus luchuensis]